MFVNGIYKFSKLFLNLTYFKLNFITKLIYCTSSPQKKASSYFQFIIVSWQRLVFNFVLFFLFFLKDIDQNGYFKTFHHVWKVFRLWSNLYVRVIVCATILILTFAKILELTRFLLRFSTWCASDLNLFYRITQKNSDACWSIYCNCEQ